MPEKPVNTNLFMPMVKEDWKLLDNILFVFFDKAKLDLANPQDRQLIAFSQELKEVVDSKLEEFREEESDELRRDWNC